jgi:hypothetical protein
MCKCCTNPNNTEVTDISIINLIFQMLKNMNAKIITNKIPRLQQFNLF